MSKLFHFDCSEGKMERKDMLMYVYMYCTHVYLSRAERVNQLI